ncbi:MAG TPA: hypothetical protein VFS10_06935 [Pyrinomonadaceae bacterium]|nr:hypothetical protein [Pyrinomonadaceae bacterium]
MNKNQLPLTIASILLALTITASLNAQAKSSSLEPTPNPVPTVSNDEVIALRAQLETMRQYDQRLLETVYWALSATGGIVLLIIGLGWYTNFRLYKRDVVDLKREIQSSLRNEMVAEARRAADSAMSDFKRIQYQTLKLEAERWERKGIEGNALYTYARMIEVAQASHPDIFIPEILDEMLRLLKGGKVLLHSNAAAEITAALETVPKRFSADVEAITQHIRTIRAS